MNLLPDINETVKQEICWSVVIVTHIPAVYDVTWPCLPLFVKSHLRVILGLDVYKSSVRCIKGYYSMYMIHSFSGVDR
ncbi:MAG: hypothetical protein WC333_05595, partial [Dehalococcoidia bacterium]